MTTPLVPLCRCAECLKGGTEVVDWQMVRSIDDGAFTLWECNVCGNRTCLATYSHCDECGLFYESRSKHDHQEDT